MTFEWPISDNEHAYALVDALVEARALVLADALPERKEQIDERLALWPGVSGAPALLDYASMTAQHVQSCVDSLLVEPMADPMAPWF